VNRQLRILNDIFSVLPSFCSPSLRRCYGVALRGSSIGPHHISPIGSSRTTRATVCLSSAHYLPTARCAVHSHTVTDRESSNDHGHVSAHLSEDVDCLHSEGSSLHIPVLAKEVVDLISPVKGQVRFWNYGLFAPKTFRPQERKVPMENFRPQGTKVPGTFVPRTFRSRELSFLGNESSRELSFPGPFVPWNFRSLGL